MATADKWQAQFNFWSRFGLPAYEENSVPDLDEVVFPYITYEARSAGFDETAVANASVWTRSSSWGMADAVSDVIEDALSHGGLIEPYTDGIIWITKGEPFSQSMGDPSDDRIKRKLLSVTLHF